MELIKANEMAEEWRSYKEYLTLQGAKKIIFNSLPFGQAEASIY